MVMSACGVGVDAVRERLSVLWRAIEDAHYSYLETDDSPEKLNQRKKLENYIMEYLSMVPHECKFGLSETGKVFQRTVNELAEFSGFRAGAGWAALARYAGNLLSQPWRKEYRTLRLYCGYYKHEVEANIVGAELLLHAMGYRTVSEGKMVLEGPICPDMVAAISRDALIAYCECQIMCQIWEFVWGSNEGVTWSDVARERSRRIGDVTAAAARLTRNDILNSHEIYSNLPTTVTEYNHLPDIRHPPNTINCRQESQDEPIIPMVPYMIPNPTMVPANVMYPIPTELPVTNPVPMMTPYGVPYYYPVQTPYMMPTPIYPPIKHATTVPVNGYPPMPQYRYPTVVPTGQLIELDAPSAYENGLERHRDDRRKKAQESSKRSSKSGFSDVSLPSLPRSDTQPTLSKAREDGMGTYESWDYVFRNLSSKDQNGDRSRYSPSFDRDSRTLDRLDREERRAKYQPTTLDLEDGLQALNLDRSYDDDAYRTAKVNENLMRLKQEQEIKKAKQIAKKQIIEDKKKRQPELVGNPSSDGLIINKVAPDKVKLLTKKDIKDRKDVIKQQNSLNGSSKEDLRKVKKSAKADIEKPVKMNGHSSSHSFKSQAGTSSSNSIPNNYDLKTHLVVSLDEVDSRQSPPKMGNQTESDTRTSQSRTPESKQNGTISKWECGTCTYINKASLLACEMCGKSKKGPEIQPLTSGGRECPACTLVNERCSRVCDACGTSLEHCPTYI